MEQVEADPHVGRARLGDQGQGGVEAGAESGVLLELDRQADAGPRGQVGRLDQRGGGPAIVFARQLAVEVDRHHQRRDAERLEDLQPAAEQVPVLGASGVAGQEQPPLLGGGDRLDPPRLEQGPGVGDRARLQVGFELGQPDFDGRPAGARVGVEVGLERGAQRGGLADARLHGRGRPSGMLGPDHPSVGNGKPSTMSRTAWTTPELGTRHCRQVSRSRKVTVPSAERLAVDRDPQGRPGLVLAAVAAADRPLLVEEDVEVPLQVAVDLLGQLGHPVALDQREDGRLDRGEPGVELEDRPGLARHLVLLIRLAEERQGRPIGPGRGLDDVGQVAFLLLLVEVGQVLAAEFLVLAEVVVAPVGDPFQLADRRRGRRTRCRPWRSSRTPAPRRRGRGGGAGRT